MIRKHEADVSWKAGILAFAVHGVLFVAMVLSINWKAAHPPMSITEVELWDQLPNKALPKPVEVKEPPKPVEPPKPIEPPKPVEPPKPEPKPEPDPPKVDIELEQKKKAAEQKKLAEEKKKAEIEKLKKEMREEELRQEKAEQAAKQKALKALQEQMLDDKPTSAQAASSVSPSVISEFTEKIKAKIRGNVNKTLCGDGNPELTFQISVLPTGDLSGSPKLVKSSGNPICDEAVERAIMVSEPLPMPADNAAKAEFRNLKLKFRPNGE